MGPRKGRPISTVVRGHLLLSGQSERSVPGDPRCALKISSWLNASGTKSRRKNRLTCKVGTRLPAWGNLPSRSAGEVLNHDDSYGGPVGKEWSGPSLARTSQLPHKSSASRWDGSRPRGVAPLPRDIPRTPGVYQRLRAKFTVATCPTNGGGTDERSHPEHDGPP
jgi:hypothetical protein